MDILVIGIDSDIGAAIAAHHTAQGDVVHTTSRNGKGTYDLELAHPRRWPKLQQKYDRIYYTIGIDDRRSTRIEVMQVNALMAMDCVTAYAKAVKDGGVFVCLTTAWGSVQRVTELDAEEATRSTWYKMSRAAFNMGVAIASRQYQNINWRLVHPGVVRTKGTTGSTFQEYKITPQQSAEGIVNWVAGAEQFAFIDYTGKTIPF